MTCKLCWIEMSIFSTAGYRVWLLPHRETWKPDGACPTRNNAKRTGGAEGGAEGDLRQTLMHLAVFHSGIYCDVY